MILLKKGAVLGFLCGCGKAMFYLRKEPKVGEPLTNDIVYVRKEAADPVKGQGIYCQWCGTHWVKLFMHPRLFRQFDEATGKEIRPDE